MSTTSCCASWFGFSAPATARTRRPFWTFWEVLETSLFAFEDRDVLVRALADFRAGKGDFSDCLIGRRNRRAGCERTVTFDQALKGSTTFGML